MSTFAKQALQKLDSGRQNGTFGPREGAMKELICKTLKNMCADEEFAQAVIQGGSFEDCMKAVAEGVGSSISDFDAITRAVQFYFPGAVIHYDIRLDLVGELGDTSAGASPLGTSGSALTRGNAPAEASPPPEQKVLSLADFW